jgi:hypothetical protein
MVALPNALSDQMIRVVEERAIMAPLQLTYVFESMTIYTNT